MNRVVGLVHLVSYTSIKNVWLQKTKNVSGQYHALRKMATLTPFRVVIWFLGDITNLNSTPFLIKRIHTITHTHARAHTHTHIYIYIYICIYIYGPYTFVRACVRVGVCACVCVNVDKIFCKLTKHSCLFSSVPHQSICVLSLHFSLDR